MHLFAITSIIVSLALSSGALGAVLETNAPRPASNIQVVTIGEHTITMTTTPVSPARLARLPLNFQGRNRSATPETSLSKRVVNNGCEFGCGGADFCSNDLSLSPDPPLLADCQALKSALDQRVLDELTDTFPCNIPKSPSCPNFVVPPGFERTYSLGTCLVGFVNLNPDGGPDLGFCDYLMAGSMLGFYDNCITNQGFTGEVCFSDNVGFEWGLEVRHV
ncbi:hypothetical protein BDN71DRAFT_980440 [Pleurotus eryngii]|uniref:Uncharacterized protein n=1 Tax=Pleurotus eryngii TaxID=5323 RepID=A0A9P6D6C0_PLEER|nr:hypothetical protein BDN71DRAFT_980440 [Pleurotus eryngii]